MLADRGRVRGVRARLRNRLLLHVATREPIQERCEPGAAGVRHFQHDQARRVGCHGVFIVFRRLIDLLDRSARGPASAAFVAGYGAHD